MLCSTLIERIANGYHQKRADNKVSSFSIENLRNDVRMRDETDRQVSTLWIILPFAVLGLLVATFLISIITFLATFSELPTPRITNVIFPGNVGPLDGLAALGGTLWIASIVVSIIFIYLTYILIKRRNRHFARQHRFYEDLAMVLKEIAARRGANVDAPLSSMDRTLRDMKMEEGQKSAALWAILTIIPFIDIIASLYVLYFLTKDFFKHERREDSLLEDVSRSIASLNLGFDPRRTEAVPERNYVLYVILTILTLGIFGIYWWYTLIKDPNVHFKNHIAFENKLLSALSAYS